jgi:hypothetical protein
MVHRDTKPNTWFFLDAAREIAIVVVILWILCLIWRNTWPLVGIVAWLLAVIAALPVYVFIMNVIGSITLPLYWLIAPNHPTRGLWWQARDRLFGGQPIIAADVLRGQRNTALFLAVVLVALIGWRGWNPLLFLVPGVLAMVAAFQQVHLCLIGSEFKGRFAEGDQYAHDVVEEAMQEAKDSDDDLDGTERQLSPLCDKLGDPGIR